MKRTLAVVLGLSLFTAACADPVAPATPTPATPTITETFTQSLPVLSANSLPFTVTQIGGVQVSLTSVDPGAALQIGVGTPSGASCLVAQGNSIITTAKPTVQLSGTATVTGNFCVSVSDPGNLVEPVTFTVIVLHS